MVSGHLLSEAAHPCSQDEEAVVSKLNTSCLQSDYCRSRPQSGPQFCCAAVPGQSVGMLLLLLPALAAQGAMGF